MQESAIKSNPTLYYENVEATKPVGKFFVKWCWPAFIFGLDWLAYRREYKNLFILTLMIWSIFFLPSISITYFKIDSQKGDIVQIIVFITLMFFFIASRIFLGIFGVSLYMKSWAKKPIPHEKNTSILAAIFGPYIATILILIGYAYIFGTIMDIGNVIF